MRLAIYVCANAHYVPLMLMFLDSFAERANIRRPFDFYCYTDDDAVISAFSVRNEFEWVKFRKGRVSSLPNYTDWSDSFFYGMGMKIFALSELLANYDRVVYFDLDMMVNRDLNELVDIDLHGKAMGAVTDFQFSRRGTTEVASPVVADVLAYRDQLMGDAINYINSGMFVIDSRLAPPLPDYDRFADENRPSLVDQDYLNYVFAGHICVLPDTFNYMVDQVFINELPMERRILDCVAMGDAHVQHFHGAAKPWISRDSSCYNEILTQANTARFLEVFDRFKTAFEKEPEYAWLTDGVAQNRALAARTDAIAKRFYMAISERQTASTG